ncbi:glycosyltransferase [Clostridium akagii]|uniref:glycosyltransferase n=1 Tax=Clostridium akagii TaxID=91623 RepID=UPI00068DB5AF|nr:glycosyltransferase [Clostridium akagii]
MKISLCMIVKNEEKYMKMCLENAMKLVDEVIIVDTGSTDKTKEIIEKISGNIKIIDYRWQDDFSKARNISLENATGDWILMLDADEKLLCDPDKVRETLANTKAAGYKIPLYNIINTKTVVYSAVYIKFFRNNKGYKYKGRIHEQINLPDAGLNENIIDEKIAKVMHYGYLESIVKGKSKSERNLRILKKELKEDPNNPFIYYNIGVGYHMAGDYEKSLKYFFKCNSIASKKSLTRITLYEIDMSKRIAECLAQLKKYDECIDMIDELLSDNCYKRFVDLEYLKGMCYYLQKQYKEAIKCFHKCTEMGETKEFLSVLGMGSFKAKFMMARCYVELKDELKAINCFMESVFDTNNFLNEGLDDFRIFLKNTNRVEILEQLNKLVSEKN